MAPWGLEQVRHPGQIALHDIAPFHLPAILAAVFCGHVTLKSDHGICAIQTGCVNGVAAHIGLKGLIIAGHAVGAGTLIVGFIEAGSRT